MTLLGYLRLGARRFRPTLWPTLITIPTLIALIALGVWQLERLEWKEALIFERQSRSQAPASFLPSSFARSQDLEFQAVRVRGRLLHDSEFYLAARAFNGQVGLHVVTPLALEAGGILLVDRGWIPDVRRDPATRPEGQLPGDLELTGLVRLPGWKGPTWLVPDNQPDENIWFWVDPAAMAEAAGLGPGTGSVIEDVYLDAGPAENPGGLPVGGQTRIELPNDHLQYALTWFALALSLTVIYVIYHLRSETDGDAS
jgi:surfeit locus 1 family protein